MLLFLLSEKACDLEVSRVCLKVCFKDKWAQLWMKGTAVSQQGPSLLYPENKVSVDQVKMFRVFVFVCVRSIYMNWFAPKCLHSPIFSYCIQRFSYVSNFLFTECLPFSTGGKTLIWHNHNDFIRMNLKFIYKRGFTKWIYLGWHNNSVKSSTYN